MTESVQPFSIHLTGYPRIGANRELKWALERHWAGKIDREEFNERIAELRHGHLASSEIWPARRPTISSCTTWRSRRR